MLLKMAPFCQLFWVLAELHSSCCNNICWGSTIFSTLTLEKCHLSSDPIYEKFKHVKGSNRLRSKSLWNGMILQKTYHRCVESTHDLLSLSVVHTRACVDWKTLSQSINYKNKSLNLFLLVMYLIICNFQLLSFFVDDLICWHQDCTPIY